jgi:hypothetical protein
MPRATIPYSRDCEPIRVTYGCSRNGKSRTDVAKDDFKVQDEIAAVMSRWHWDRAGLFQAAPELAAMRRPRSTAVVKLSPDGGGADHSARSFAALRMTFS